MSIDDNLPSAVHSIATHLHDLLSLARDAKTSSSIDPPLQPSELESAVGALSTDPNLRPLSEAYLHTAFETAARNIFYSILSTHSIASAEFVQLWNLLDIIQLCADSKKCDASLVLWLIEELLDSQTISGCRRVFDYLESRRERLITKAFSMNKQMIMLRSCNELLRRLSRAEDAVFCGRVFIFLFQSFPLGDKSAVNLRGEFHVDNITKFDLPPAKKAKLDGEAGADADADAEAGVDAMDVDADKEIQDAPQDAPQAGGSRDGQKKNTDGKEPEPETELDPDELYAIFWSLQDVFSNPKTVFSQPKFDAFKKGLELTVRKFKAVPKVLQAHGKGRNADASSRGAKRKRSLDDDGDDDFTNTFNPKYLTSRDLFDLEMNDLTFQRHILVQALILIDFLLSLTPKAKRKLAEVNAQRAMVYEYTLTDDDAKWATTTRSSIASYLQSLPEGSHHNRMVSTILTRDKNWVRWKVESCPPISRPPVATSTLTDARSAVKRATTNRRLKATPMGAIDVDFISDRMESGEWRLEQLKQAAPEAEEQGQAKQQWQRAPLETWMREIENVDLDLEMAPDVPRSADDDSRRMSAAEKADLAAKREEHDRLVADRSSRSWRVMKIAAQTRMGLIPQIDESKTESLKAVLKPDEKPKPVVAPADSTNTAENGAGEGAAEGAGEGKKAIEPGDGTGVSEGVEGEQPGAVDAGGAVDGEDEATAPTSAPAQAGGSADASAETIKVAARDGADGEEEPVLSYDNSSGEQPGRPTAADLASAAELGSAGEDGNRGGAEAMEDVTS